MIQIDKLREIVKAMYSPPLDGLEYHNWRHTSQVEEAVRELGTEEGVSDQELLWLRSAAYLHDVGNLIQREGHEKISTEIAEKLLVCVGATAQEISIVKKLIMATCMPQKPSNNVEEIICDADLSLLGKPHLLEESENLRIEMGIADLHDWNLQQLAFIDGHTYFTKAAKHLYDKQKQRNRELLVKRISK